MAKYLSIVVPLLNEEGNIKPLYRAIRTVCEAHAYDYETIFVDDGSMDQTLSILKELADKDNRFIYLSLKRNFGQTAALAAGLDCATGRFIVTLDGDRQNDPADIPGLLEACEKGGYDLVNGWRKHRKDPFFTSVLPSNVANRIIKKITGVRIHDTGCTLKIFRREILEELHLYGEMHRFIPALLHWTGAKIGEKEVTHHARQWGKSKYSLRKLPRIVLDLINIKFLISYSTRPIQVFGKFGLYAFFFCLVSLSSLIYMKTAQGIDMTGNPFLFLTIFLGFIGVQFVTMGLLGEINIRIYHESTRRKIYRIAERGGVS
ncbi:MAG: glycosyl transferase [Elusimicrobia bacterium RIFOXYB2_FULL_49_7]|nr:MAG: glycosyl transferase [Elusimicrobia bacterium RIFOXYB2_FULL_49_7]